jgi:hypothetical protein
LSTLELATFGLEGQLERREMAGGSPDARLVLKLVDHRPREPPGGGCHYVVTN